MTETTTPVDIDRLAEGTVKRPADTLVTGQDGSPHILRVNEYFHSFQGEGPSTGRAATFLRLAGCNLDCQWCDTPYTWDWSGKNGHAYDREAETHAYSIPEVLGWLRPPLDVAPLLVITGGEPLLQSRAIARLVRDLRAGDCQARIEIETNGTRPPPDALRKRVYYNVSPKLPSAGTSKNPFAPGALAEFARDRAIFKFVVCWREDIEAIEAIVRIVGNIRAHQVWVMPEGRDAATIDTGMRMLAPLARERGWNLSGRMHVSLWGDERGR